MKKHQHRPKKKHRVKYGEESFAVKWNKYLGMNADAPIYDKKTNVKYFKTENEAKDFERFLDDRGAKTSITRMNKPKKYKRKMRRL